MPFGDWFNIALLILRTVPAIGDCIYKTREKNKILYKISIVVLSIATLTTITLTLILIRHLCGMRKMFIVLQQFFILAYLVLELGQIVLKLKPDETDMFVKQKLYWLKGILELLQNYCYYEYYFLALMQSIDIYQMVCKPMGYADFLQKTNMARYMLIGSAGCLSLASAVFIPNLIVELTYPKTDIEFPTYFYQYNRTRLWIRSCNLCIFMIVKIIYSTKIVMIASLTKTGLDESANRVSLSEKKTLYQHLFYFTLIPLFLNFLFFASELLPQLKRIMLITREANDCDKNEPLVRDSTLHLGLLYISLDTWCCTPK